MNAVERWWNDVDKVSTDGKDDGNLSFKEKAESFGKGLFGGIIKEMIKNPLTSLGIAAGTGLVSYGLAAALTKVGVVAAGPIVGAGLALVGLGFGISAIIKGAKAAKAAKNDADAKTAWESIGTGTAVSAMSLWGGIKAGKQIHKDYSNVKQINKTTAKSANTAKNVQKNPNSKSIQDHKYPEQEISAFNRREGAYTSEQVEAIYTKKGTFTEASGHFKRKIEGSSGYETETYINVKPEHSGYDRFSEFKFKYSDGRRVQQNIYDEFGRPHSIEYYNYNSKGQLVEVKVSEFNLLKGKYEQPKLKHAFKYNSRGQLLEEVSPFTRSKTNFNYNADGTLASKISNKGTTSYYDGLRLTKTIKHTKEEIMNTKIDIYEKTKFPENGKYTRITKTTRQVNGENKPYSTVYEKVDHIGKGIFEYRTKKGNSLTVTQKENIPFARENGII